MINFSKGPSQPQRLLDTLTTDDTIELLLGLGEGPIKGLRTPADFFVDDTPLVSEVDKSNFQNFALDIWPGAETGHVVELYLGGASSPVPISQTLIYNVPVTRQGLQTLINAIDVRFVIQRLLKQNDKGSFTNKLELKIEVKKVTDATWSPAWYQTDPAPGVAPGSVYTPNPDGTGAGTFVNYDRDASTWNNADTARGFDFMLATGTGAPSGGIFGNAVRKYVDTTDTTGLYTFRDGLGWVREPVSNGSTTFDGRKYTTGAAVPLSPAVGDMWSPSASTIYIFNGTAFVTPGEFYQGTPAGLNQSGIWVIDEKISSSTARDIRVFVNSAASEYQVRVTKLSPESTTENFTDVVWESLSEIKRGPLAFDQVATLRLVATASEQFTGVPNLSGTYDGRVIKVPTNYNPDTRVYTGVWDGTYKKAYTNCTAWILLDFIENTTYGLSSIYPHTANKWKFYEFGQWCDTMVARPDGSLRPRWTFNDFVFETRDGFEMAQYIAGSAGAYILDDGNGSVDLIIDRSDDAAVMLFTPENVSDKGFTYTYTDRYTRPNETIVEFTNPNLNWSPDKRRVVNQGDIDEFGQITDNFVAVGCTDVDEAMARGRRRHITGLTEKEMVSLETNRQGVYLDLWNVILVADPKMGRALTGRISTQPSSTSVTVRDPVTLEPGFTYKITFIKPNTTTGALETKEATVTTAAGTGTTLTFTPAIASLIEYANFSLAASNVGYPKPYRVLGIEDNGGDGEMVSITAIELNRSKQSYIDVGGVADPVDYGALDFRTVAPPVAVTAQQVVGPTGWLLKVLWGASPTSNLQGYEVEHFINQTLAHTYSTPGLSLEINDAAEASHLFVVRAVSSSNRRSRSAGGGINLVGVARVVPAPTNLRVVGASILSTRWQINTPEPVLEWDPITYPGFSHYLVTVGGQEINVGAAVRWQWLSLQQAGAARITAFTVTAVNLAGERSLAAPITLENKAPLAPTITVTPNTTGLLVVLSPATELDVVGALVSVTTTSGTTNIQHNVNQTSLTILLSDSTVRYIKAAYYDDFGTSGLNWSAESSGAKAAITSGDLDTTPPATPTGLGFSSSRVIAPDGTLSVQVTANWDDNAESDLDGYNFVLYADNVLVSAERVTASQKAWFARVGVNYVVSIFAVDKLGNISTSAASNSTGPIAGDTTAPGPLTSFTATPVQGGLLNTWTLPTDRDYAYAQFYRDTTGVGPTSQSTTPTHLNIPGRTWTDTNLTPGTGYYYWSRTVDQSGNVSSYAYMGSGTAGAVAITGQTDWATYTGRSPTQLAAAINSSGEALTLSSSTTVKHSSGATSPVSGQPYAMVAGDAEAVTFPIEYGVPPLVFAVSPDNLKPLVSSGDYYVTAPANVTKTGFTGRALIRNPGTSGTPTARQDSGSGGASATNTNSLSIAREKSLTGVASNGAYTLTCQVKTRGRKDGSDPIIPQTMTVGFYGRGGAETTWTLLGQITVTSAATLTTVTSTRTIAGYSARTTWAFSTVSGTSADYEYKIEVISGYVADEMCLYNFTSVDWTEQVGGSPSADVVALADGKKLTYLVFPLAG